jgi:hypothetical protein
MGEEKAQKIVQKLLLCYETEGTLKELLENIIENNLGPKEFLIGLFSKKMEKFKALEKTANIEEWN